MRDSVQLGRLWRTVRPLRREQVLGRFMHELRQRAFRAVPGLLPWRLGPMSSPEIAFRTEAHGTEDTARLDAARKTARDGTASLAGHEVPVRAWSDLRYPKLVRYHLHYLDAAYELSWAGATLVDSGFGARALALVSDWARENPPRGSEAWEPYPVAVRLGNLARMAALVGPETPEWLRSLMAQHAQYLNAFPERHLQANHLLQDWVALSLTGLICRGSEAEVWRRRGLTQLRHELCEQVLPDGGHYERSPMYHSQILSDLLDVRDFARSRAVSVPWLETVILRMAAFLMEVLHPDGQIPLFNDAVIGQAPSPASILARLDSAPEIPADGVFDSPDFGLSVLRASGREYVVSDSGPLGPPHQPGHAHSDTLSFELSVDGARVAVNAGMDGYQSPNRSYFRSAAAHNTVTVDGQGPDELWSTFRVGGRSRVLWRKAWKEGGVLVTSAALQSFHGWNHARTLLLVPGKALVVVDEIARAPVGAALCSRARLVPDTQVRFQPLWGMVLPVRSAPYAPRFGSPVQVLEHAVSGVGPSARLAYALLWGASRVDVATNGETLDLVLDDKQISVARLTSKDLA